MLVDWLQRSLFSKVKSLDLLLDSPGPPALAYKCPWHIQSALWLLFGQGHKGQTQSPCQNGAKSPEERQQNAEEAHRARGSPWCARQGTRGI